MVYFRMIYIWLFLGYRRQDSPLVADLSGCVIHKFCILSARQHPTKCNYLWRWKDQDKVFGEYQRKRERGLPVAYFLLLRASCWFRPRLEYCQHFGLFYCSG